MDTGRTQTDANALDESRLQRLRTRYLSLPRAERYHANRYGDMEGRLNLYAMRRAILRALATVPSGGRVLDIPCGTAQYTWFLAANGYRPYGSDVSPQMLEVASKPRFEGTGPKPEFGLADIFKLHFAPETFDASISIRFFHLLNRAERIAALGQMGKVSKLVVADYGHKFSLKHWSRVVRHRLGLRREPRIRFDREEVSKEASEAGLQVRQLVWVAPGLSEIWLAVMVKK